jgi:hypothetical protein
MKRDKDQLRAIFRDAVEETPWKLHTYTSYPNLVQFDIDSISIQIPLEGDNSMYFVDGIVRRYQGDITKELIIKSVKQFKMESALIDRQI